MSRIVTSGFEIYSSASGATDTVALQEVGAPDGYIAFTPTVFARDTTHQRSGNACLALTNPSSGTGNWTRWPLTVLTGDHTYYLRFYLRIGVATNSTLNPIATIGLTDGGVYLDTASKVYSPNDTVNRSPALNDGAYHRIEMMSKFSTTQANRAWELRVDGTTISSGTNMSGVNSSLPAYIQVGSSGVATTTLYFDDIVLNDDQGTSYNTWPGDSKIVLMTPVAHGGRVLRPE